MTFDSNLKLYFDVLDVFEARIMSPVSTIQLILSHESKHPGSISQTNLVSWFLSLVS
jgi:hypothetical protein